MTKREEAVEAAAIAINMAGWTYEGVCEPGEYCVECRKVCVEVARAALAAAQGAAPQAESEDRNYLTPHEERLIAYAVTSRMGLLGKTHTLTVDQLPAMNHETEKD